jgi:hypothetical protein
LAPGLSWVKARLRWWIWSCMHVMFLIISIFSIISHPLIMYNSPPPPLFTLHSFDWVWYKINLVSSLFWHYDDRIDCIEEKDVSANDV